MNYTLSYENETYPVEDIRIPAASTLAHEPVGQPFSFISPVRMTTGQRCVLRGDSGGYQLLINACFGFTYSTRYLVSGIIATQTAAVESAV